MLKVTCLSFALLLSMVSITSADAPVAGYVADSPMARVARELDMGGTVFQLNDGAYQWASVAWLYEFFPSVIGMGMAADPSTDLPPNLPDTLEKIPDILGLNQILAGGKSTVALPGGGYLSRNVSLLQADAPGWLWHLHGKPFVLEDEIRKLPPSTAALLRVGFNAPYSIRRGMQVAREIGVPDEILDEITTKLPTNHELTQAATNALHEGVTLAITLNPEVEWHLPLPGMQAVPETGIILLIPDENEHLGQLVLSQLEESYPAFLQSLEIQGVEAKSFPVPVPLPSAVALTLARVDGHLAVTSSTALMDSLLVSRAGEGERPLLDRLPENLPGEAVAAWINNEAFRNLLTDVMHGSMQMQAAMTAGMQPDMNPMQMMQGWVDVLIDAYSTSVILEVRDDIRQAVLLHETPMMSGASNQALTISAPMTVGMLAAIALPGFTRARQTAQSNACVNNLRQIESAKDQWAIETNRREGDPVTKEDILDYLRDRTLPACPAGGAYELGTIGEPATCTLGETSDGHQLNW